jgi:hypothetical protein
MDVRNKRTLASSSATWRLRPLPLLPLEECRCACWRVVPAAQTRVGHSRQVLEMSRRFLQHFSRWKNEHISTIRHAIDAVAVAG